MNENGLEQVDVRIGVIGNVDSGKSTLIGVLVSGELDDGRGIARRKVFRHPHEDRVGRTSAISQHMMGFDANYQPVYQIAVASAQSAAKTRSWRQVVQNSENSLITFIDLAGHEKYLKTTIAGLTGCHPHYACVLVGANMGVSKMTREHMGIAMFLNIPLFVVITKIDIAPENILKKTIKSVFKIIRKSQNKKHPLIVRSEEDLNKVLGCETENELTPNDMVDKITPVFLVSSVTGTNIDLLLNFLAHLRPERMSIVTEEEEKEESSELAEMQIEDIFSVTGVGCVVSGIVRTGTISVNDSLLVGPFGDGAFRSVIIRGLHSKRVQVDSVSAGNSCAAAIRSVDKKYPVKRSNIRKGMSLVHPNKDPRPVRSFKADVVVLQHPTTIKNNYQSVVHCGSMRQACRMELPEDAALRTGSKDVVQFTMLYHPEYLHVGSTIIFREGTTKGIGKIIEVSNDKTASP